MLVIWRRESLDSIAFIYTCFCSKQRVDGAKLLKFSLWQHICLLPAKGVGSWSCCHTCSCITGCKYFRSSGTGGYNTDPAIGCIQKSRQTGIHKISSQTTCHQLACLSCFHGLHDSLPSIVAGVVIYKRDQLQIQIYQLIQPVCPDRCHISAPGSRWCIRCWCTKFCIGKCAVRFF